MAAPSPSSFCNFSFIYGNRTDYPQDFLDSVRKGLSKRTNKSIPCRFLYDHQGSDLFEEITTLKEYYPTRCELEILMKQSDSIANTFSVPPMIVELGSGSSIKTRVLLESFLNKFGSIHYVPIDISPSILKSSGKQLTFDYPKLKVTAYCGSYQDGLTYLLQHFDKVPKLILFLGSSIGNFERSEAAEFLLELSKTMGPYDQFLLGIDLRKDPSIIHDAYNDSRGVTERFIMNVLQRVNRELGGNFQMDQFSYKADYLVKEGKVSMRIVSKKDQQVPIGALHRNIRFENQEIIHVEDSVKYSPIEIDILTASAGLSITEMWFDSARYFSLSLVSLSSSSRKLMGSFTNTETFLKQLLLSSWEYSDGIFELLTPQAFFEKPISLRHPFIFYFGHLPAFAHNQICNFFNVDNAPSFNPYFDRIFERGIDPNVEDPTICHPHSQVPNKWPTIAEIAEYKIRVRKRVMDAIPLIFEIISPTCEKTKLLMAINGRVFFMVAEHDLMHAETLLYMYQDLENHLKVIPDDYVKNYIFGKNVIPKTQMIHIPNGIVRMGAEFHEIVFGWDNEFPSYTLHVRDFHISKYPVTNGEFLQFVISGEYNNPQHWTARDWDWKEKSNLQHPHCWKKVDSIWHFKTVFDLIPLDQVQDWPVYVSQAEAKAYASWKGMRLPTEPELIHAMYGNPGSPNMLCYPWGDQVPIPGYHGNFHLYSWAPTPVTRFPKGKSKFGLYDVIGNGWEWTSTVFEGFPGFTNFIPSYPGYSKDFFDGHHYVLLGASWATPVSLIRKSFRNWYQAHYQYPFAKFRLCSRHSTPEN